MNGLAPDDTAPRAPASAHAATSVPNCFYHRLCPDDRSDPADGTLAAPPLLAPPPPADRDDAMLAGFEYELLVGFEYEPEE